MTLTLKLLVLLALVVLSLCGFVAAPYAEWAHSHVVWINKAQQSEQKIYQLVKDYLAHGIPVGGVNIDSQWSTCINTFTVNRQKFPHMESIVKDFHNQGIKVILWATSIINKECPEYAQGASKKYFLNKGKTIKWWHGHGAFVDFFNPAAKKWFEGLMDRVLDMGFDGWKCDGADPLIYLLRPFPYSAGLKRFITFPEYANQYYGTFYNYTKSRNKDALIMARPVDSQVGLIYPKFAPKYVMFSGWVGDQANTQAGFKEAMINIIHSASNNYLNFGFDIGGYLGKAQSQKWLFLRWTQVGSLLPFMENGGGGKHQPWLFDSQTVDIYRSFVLLHYSLKQFFLSAGTQAYNKKKSVVQPIVKDKRFLQFTHDTSLAYVLWNTFLVSPIFQENGFVEVVFPSQHQWIYYFNHSRVYEGGSTSNMGIRLNQTALFIRSNNIIPISKQIWLVYLKEGLHSKTIVGGDYSDEVAVDYNNGKLSLIIERYFKDEEARIKISQEHSIKIRLVGLERPSAVQVDGITQDRIFMSTEYQNEFQVEIELNQRITFTNMNFSIASPTEK